MLVPDDDVIVTFRLTTLTPFQVGDERQTFDLHLGVLHLINESEERSYEMRQGFPSIDTNTLDASSFNLKFTP